MKPIYKKLLIWSLLILHIMLIFSFSLQDAQESTVVSNTITTKVKTREQLEEQIRNDADTDGGLSEKRVEMLAKKDFSRLDGIVRKIAHITLFFILGILINLLLKVYVIKRLPGIVISPVYAMAVGFFDETIQIFSPGRAGSLSDVFIDFAGAVIASLLFFAGGKLYEKTKEKRLNMDS